MASNFMGLKYGKLRVLWVREICSAVGEIVIVTADKERKADNNQMCKIPISILLFSA